MNISADKIEAMANDLAVYIYRKAQLNAYCDVTKEVALKHARKAVKEAAKEASTEGIPLDEVLMPSYEAYCDAVEEVYGHRKEDCPYGLTPHDQLKAYYEMYPDKVVDINELKTFHREWVRKQKSQC